MLIYNIIDHLDDQSSLHGMMWRHTSAFGRNRTTGTTITFPSKTIENQQNIGKQSLQTLDSRQCKTVIRERLETNEGHREITPDYYLERVLSCGAGRGTQVEPVGVWVEAADVILKRLWWLISRVNLARPQGPNILEVSVKVFTMEWMFVPPHIHMLEP